MHYKPVIKPFSGNRMILTLCILIFMLQGCNIATVRFTSWQRPVIALPDSINRILIVYRIRHSREAKSAAPSYFGILRRTIADSLNKLSSYKVNKTSLELYAGNYADSFPKPILWDNIKKWCRENDCDAILSIETYSDTFGVTTVPNYGTKKVKSGQGYVVNNVIVSYTATAYCTINIGFRFYDPKSMRVSDQYTISMSDNWPSVAKTSQQAEKQAIKSSKAENIIANRIGCDYYARLLPAPVEVSRHYFIKSGQVPELEKGYEKAKNGDLSGAVVLKGY